MFPPEKIDLPPWREDEFDEGAPERNRVLHQILGAEADALEDIYGVMGVYYGMVRFIDDGLGQILDALENLGLRETRLWCSAPTTGTSWASTGCSARAVSSTTA